MRRSLPRLAAVLLTAASLGLAGLVLAAPAEAAGRSGGCTGADTGAVTVVVDFQALGGGTATYCASGLAAGATGLTALAAVGLSTQGTTHDGASFICRLAGAYQENCVNTPPASAYWTYWSARQGGSWSYSSKGGNQPVDLGGYIGFSFALGKGPGQAPPPRVAPAVWAAPPQPQPAPTQPAAPAAPAAGSGQTHDQPGTAATQPAAGRPAPANQSTSGADRPAASSGTVGSSEGPVPGTSESSPAATELPSSPGLPSPSVTGSSAPSSTPSPSPSSGLLVATSGSAGPGWPLAVAAGLILVLGAAAVVVARRRKGRAS